MGTYGPQAPIQDADEHLHRRASHRQQVLDAEEAPRESYVGEETDGECRAREREADDSQVLHMPSIGRISAYRLSMTAGSKKKREYH